LFYNKIFFIKVDDISFNKQIKKEKTLKKKKKSIQTFLRGVVINFYKKISRLFEYIIQGVTMYFLPLDKNA
jgi:hypothetical protein